MSLSVLGRDPHLCIGEKLEDVNSVVAYCSTSKKFRGYLFILLTKDPEKMQRVLQVGITRGPAHLSAFLNECKKSVHRTGTFQLSCHENIRPLVRAKALPDAANISWLTPGPTRREKVDQLLSNQFVDVLSVPKCGQLNAISYNICIEFTRKCIHFIPQLLSIASAVLNSGKPDVPINLVKFD